LLVILSKVLLRSQGFGRAARCCYAEITLELKRKGKPIPTNVVWIAALCRQHSLPLLSRDRHFDLVAGTKRIGW
jgi:predicted nucleic acid-binding protein